ncbi:MAG: GNAT family N-acetyltransferase [Leptolyngbya sp. SIO1D8]|nr:GNAT family N-acetyltransferase [Leptolyngbya sp. SIO1D8]
MKTTFQLASEELIPEILEMMADFNAIDHYPFDKKTGRQNLEQFLTNNHLGRLWTIHVEGSVVGYIALTFGFSFEYKGRDAFIDEFFIKEGFRNRGIGRETMEFIEGQAVELDVKAIHLEVEKHNEKGKRLYINQGYKSNDRMLLSKRTDE